MSVDPRRSAPTGRSTRVYEVGLAPRTRLRLIAALGALALLLPGFAPVVPRSVALANGPLACEVAFPPQAPDLVAGKYEIASEENLVFLSVNFDEPVGNGDADEWREKHFVQTKNLNLAGCLWTSIGQKFDQRSDLRDAEFEGTYDGDNKTITGLTIDAPGVDNVGMFGTTVKGAILKNIHLVDVSITGGESVGGLVGDNDDRVDDEGSRVENSSVTGIVAGVERVGGLVGENGGDIVDSISTADVAGAGPGLGDKIGGLVGDNLGLGSIDGSSAVGSVVGVRRVGGLVGINSGSIANSYAKGTATGPRDVGGLVGRNDGSIANSYAAGAITATGTPSNIGGLVGLNNGSVVRSYWDTETTELATSAGGTGELTEDMQKRATFVGWDFLGDAGVAQPVWAICAPANGGYPFLLWQFASDSCGSTSTDATTAPLTPVLSGGVTPVVPTGEGSWQQVDGSTKPLAVTSPGTNQVRYSTDGITVTFTGAAGTSVANGLVANPNGEIVCEVCSELPVGQVIEVWMFSTPRLVAAHLIGPGECQTFTIPLGTPLDGGGPVSVGAHTLQLALPTASGMQAVNVGVTVGGLVPASVPAGEGPAVPVGLLALTLLAAAGAVAAVRRQVVAG